MATFAEVEDLRDWLIDNCGEFLKRLDVLNGDEPTDTMLSISQFSASAHASMQEVCKHLDELLIQKKRDEFTP